MVLSAGVQRANMSRYQRTPLKNTDNVVEVKSKVSGWFINFTFMGMELVDRSLFAVRLPYQARAWITPAVLRAKPNQSV